jgi:hypothetical protein
LTEGGGQHILSPDMHTSTPSAGFLLRALLRRLAEAVG